MSTPVDRRALLAGLAGLCVAPPSFAAEKRVPETLRSARAKANESKPTPSETESVAGSGDARDRLTVPVWLNGRGPFQFAVDTAAERCVIATEIAQKLGLQVARQARLHGIAGAEPCETVRVAELSFGSLRSTNLESPILPRARLEVDGLVGLDALENRCVTLDFNARTMEVAHARRPSFSSLRRSGEATVNGMSRLGQLTFVDCSADGVRIYAFIDSGAEMSVGNEALVTALHGARIVADEPPIKLQGATGQSVLSRRGMIERFQLGPVQFRSMAALFADLHVFDLWDLRDRPALLVGCDVLKLFASVELDFGRYELRLKQAEAAPVRVARIG